MIRSLVLSLSLPLTIAMAVAQEIDIKPGEWQWSGDAALGPANFTDDGRECLTSSDVDRTLESLAMELDPTCAVSSVNQDASVTRLRLVCTGATTADADVEIDARGDSATLRLQGVLYPGSPLQSDVLISGKAVRLGSC